MSNVCPETPAVDDDDTMTGDTGNDTVPSGNDTVDGSTGDDTLAENPVDTVDGSTGNDTGFGTPIDTVPGHTKTYQRWISQEQIDEAWAETSGAKQVSSKS